MIKRLSLSLNKLITFTQTTLFSLSIKNDFQDWILGPFFFFLRKSSEKKNKNILGIQFCQGNKISKTQTQHTWVVKTSS